MLLFKSLYTCFINETYSIEYFIIQFISHIPIFAEYLLSLISSNSLNSEILNYNQYITGLMVSGGLGTSFGKALKEILFLNLDSVD